MSRLAIACFALLTVGFLAARAGAQTYEFATKMKGTRRAEQRLDRLAQDPALAEQTLGPGMRIIRLEKGSIVARDIYDTPDGRLSTGGGAIVVRHNATKNQLNFKPNGGTTTGRRIDLGVQGLVAGAKAPVFEKITSGGQHTLYALQKDGKHVGELELSSNFAKGPKGTSGFGSFEFSGRLQTAAHAARLVKHLGLNTRPVAGKGAMAVQRFGLVGRH